MIKADEIKMLPVFGMKKIEILKKYIDDDIHDPRVDKKNTIIYVDSNIQ